MSPSLNGGESTHTVQIDSHNAANTEPMAIIGLAIRAADEATDAEAFWDFLLRARQASRPIPEDRISSKAFYHPDPDHGGSFYAKGASFLGESPNGFDAAFFKMSKTEVQSLDPQQRILMENVYHALENAGLPMEDVISSNTSVFVSGFNRHHADRINSDLELSFKHKPTGMENSMISGRVSWFYNFEGASLTVDTACSSSLVALHLARQNLAANESKMAIVSGVSVMGFLPHLLSMSYSGLFGSEGKSMAFDQRADGYGFGEGVGTIILKPLSAALRDGDTIRAVVRGTGINHDGHTPGLTYPSPTAQESLIRKTYLAAGLNTKDTTYAESHGTGTQAGDLIECAAIAAAFETHKRNSPFYIGAVKPNVGHLEGAAGIAGVIKSILLLESGIIPPNATLKEVNANIQGEWNVRFPTRCIPWPTSGVRRSSISAYGISGTNAHCILDDAFHYLQERGLSAPHNTRKAVPNERQIEEILAETFKKYQTEDEGRDLRQSLVNGDDADTHGVSSTSSTNGFTQENGANGVNGLNGVHGVNGVHKVNGVNGPNGVNGVNGSNGINCTKGTNGTNGVKNQPLSSSQLAVNAAEVPKIYLFSAFDEPTLRKVVTSVGQHVSSWPLESGPLANQALNDLAFSLSEKRSRLPWKTYSMCSSVKELQEKLSQFPSKTFKSRSPLRIGFVLTGQGAQYARMGEQLLVYPVFRQSVEAADLYFRSLGSYWSLLEELCRDAKDSKVSTSALAHPMSCAIQIALIDLLISWNVVPHRVTGHSSGEIGAAYCAGKISREAAWKVAYYRGHVHLRGKTPSVGGMIAVGLEEKPLLILLKKVHTKLPGGTLSIACYNSPRNHTVSGDDAMVDALKEILDEQGIFARKLKVGHAAHSAHMECLSADYEALMGTLPSKRLLHFDHPVHMFSTLTGRLLDDYCVPEKPSHWCDSIVGPVRFTEALGSMCFDATPADGVATLGTWVDVILEIGPHPAMQSASKEIIGSKADIPYLATLSRKDTGLNTFLNTIGSLAALGAPVDLDKVNRAVDPSITPKMMVDLPTYPFNHEEQGLYESRLIKNTRLRKFPRHDLFGAPVPDWNPNSPRWRHFLRVSENPWLKEHIIGDDYVFPGAGYVVMALEGMQQITETSEVIGIHLEDIVFKSMLVVPDNSQGVEVCLSFYPEADSKTAISASWKRFEIASYDPNTEEWVEHCTGKISPDYKKPLNPIDGPRQEEADKIQWSEFVQTRESSCKTPVDFDHLYAHLRDIEINHGVSFRHMSNVAISDRERGLMTGDIVVPDIKKLMPKQYAHDHLIHPTTLDHAFQAAFAAIYDLKGKTMLRRGCVPSSVRKMWVSTTGLSSEPGTKLRCTCEASAALYASFESDIHAWDHSNTSTKLFSLTGARMAPFKPERDDESANDTKFHYSVDWHPDMDLLLNQDLQKLLPPSELSTDTYESQLEWLSKLQLASTLLATDGLLAARGVDDLSLTPDHKKYQELLRGIAANISIDAIPYVPLETWLTYSRNPGLKKRLYREVESRNPDGELLIRMGSNISSILRKEITTEYLLFEKDDLFWRWDQTNLLRGNILPTLTQYLNILRGNYRSMRILDIRGRSGDLSEHILKTLCPGYDTQFIEKYVLGSLTPDGFAPLKERLSAWNNIITYKTIDLGANPFEQGFEPESFDFVIANNYVHGMSNMEEIFQRLNALTRPGGRLLVFDETRPESLHTNVSFGSLPVWWEAIEPFRKVGIFAEKTEYDRLLRKSGFSGIELEASSSTYAEFADFSMMSSTSVKSLPQAAASTSEVLVLLQSESAISHSLTKRLIDEGIKYSVCQLDALETDILAGKTCISLMEASRPILSNMDSKTFQRIRQLLITSTSLLWVMGDPLTQPEFQMATGLLRTIRWEQDCDNLNLVSLSLDGEPTATVESNVDAIFRVLQHQFLDQGSRNANSEYRVRNQVIETNRVIKNAGANTAIDAKLLRPKPTLFKWDEITHPVRLTSPHPGVDSLVWATDEDFTRQPLADYEIEIDVRAVGLNFKDLLVAMGEIAQPGFGHEAAGIVRSIGASVSDLKPGDRVMCLGDPSPGRMGTLRTYSRIHSGLAIRIPDNLSFEIAAGMPVIYGTVIYSLSHIARLRAGEKILIHAAAGGIGQAAIQYAKVKGAEIFVTLSSPEKKKFVMDTFKIPEDHIFSSRDLTFAQGIKKIAPRGVDVVLNSLSGEALRQSWASVAPFGRFVEIGKLDLQAGSKLDMTPFLHNVTFAGVDLNALAEERPEICQDILKETMDLFSAEKIREARPTQVFGYGQLKDGMRLLQTGKSIGKISLVPNSHPVSAMPVPLPPLELDPNASFVLAGGLGGIGRSIAVRLATMGARNLIFLSRSAAVHEAGQSTIAELKNLGCASHVFQCDISDDSRLRLVFAMIRESLPPVKGCIQCCFVLRDGAFHSMTHNDWQTALAPKVAGSWNLHRLLPDVDFFLMLSSITGIIGNRSQANYNAGNNFQDALARYRVSKGMNGASINLGAVVGIGFIAENHEYAGKHTFKVANQQNEEEVLAAIEYLIDRRYHTTVTPTSAQLVCGLRTPASYSIGNEVPPTHLQYPMFSHVPPALSGSANATDTEVVESATRTRDHLQVAPTREEAAQIILKAIRHKMADLLNVSGDSFDDSLNVRTNGVDSLIEMEFRTWLAKELGATVPLKDLAKDLNQLSVRIASLSSFTTFC